MEAPTAVFEEVTPEEVVYQRGAVYQKLTGFLAGMYKAQCALYGKARATEMFWWLWHKKEGSEMSEHKMM